MTPPDAERVRDARSLLEGWVAPTSEQDQIRRTFVEYLSQHADALARECRPHHLTASAIVLTADARQVCLVLHNKVKLWLQSGGHIEAGDRDLTAAALREASEETGLEDLRIDPTPVWLSSHEVPFCTGAGGHHLDVQFVAIAQRANPPQASEESERVAWFDVNEPPQPTDDDVLSLLRAATQRLRGTHLP